MVLAHGLLKPILVLERLDTVIVAMSKALASKHVMLVVRQMIPPSLSILIMSRVRLSAVNG